ncbi:MAG: peptidase M50 [Actinobacteria bacterium]|nr:MAG: peptidase M50 [Actinomycetota bacterium]
MTWALAIAGFIFLILLHEYGHFLAAKAVGMRVERFSLFFGKPLVKVRRGETEYAIGPIPAGGYVKITGMNPTEEVPEDVAPRSYFRQPVWKRVVVILAGPGMNIFIALALLWAVFLHNGYVEGSSRVGQVDANAPAFGHLASGDKLVAVDGHGGTLLELSDRIASHSCPGRVAPGCRARTPVRITVRRGPRNLTFSLYPRYDAKAGRMRVGFGFVDHKVSTNPVNSVGYAGQEMWSVTSNTVSTFARFLFSSQARSQVHGAVGISKVTQESFKLGFVQGLLLLAIVSLSLAIVNLFPFLPLDGGHVFWAVGEKLRGGRPISLDFMQRWSAVGVVLVIFVVITGFTNDISTLQNGGFHVR